MFFFSFYFFDGFIDKYAAILYLNLVNQSDLDKILKAEVFVYEDGQLRVAHLFLGYNPLSSSFQAPKCVIRAKDKRLHLINVVIPGFLNQGPAPEGVQQIELPFRFTSEEEATPSQPTIKEKEEVVEVLDSEDNFEVFNRPQSLKAPAKDFSSLPPAQVSQTQ